MDLKKHLLSEEKDAGMGLQCLLCCIPKSLPGGLRIAVPALNYAVPLVLLCTGHGRKCMLRVCSHVLCTACYSRANWRHAHLTCVQQRTGNEDGDH